MKSLLLNTALVVSVLLFLPVAFAGDIDSLQSGEVVEYFAVQGLGSTDVGGLICTNTTWTLAGSPYLVTGSSGIVIGCNAKLTIEPGVVVQFNPTLAIVVGSAAFGNGNLVARGTEELPITFTSGGAGAAGDWSRIHFTDYSVDAAFDVDEEYVSGGILEHVVVEYAGYGNYGAVFAEKSSPFLSHCLVRSNCYYGIQVDALSASNINIKDCEVCDNAQRGVSIINGTGHKLSGNNIHNNKGGISISASNCTLNDNTVTNNTMASPYGGGIYCENGNTINGNTITGNTGSYYGGGIHCGSNNALTENTISGNTVIWTGGGISCGSNNAFTENTITGNTATSEYGGGIYGSDHNTLTGNTISGNTANQNGGGIYLGSGYNTLLENTISDNTSSNGGGGIYFNGSYNTLSANTIQNNTSSNGNGAAICISGAPYGSLSRNTITDNHINTGATGGIYVTNGSTYLSLAGDPGTGVYNIIQNNDGYQVYNDNAFNADGRNDINARYIQWGTSDTDIIQGLIYDYFDNGSKAFVIFYPFVIPGDFDMDGDVDLVDLATLAENWVRDDCSIPDWCEGADLNVSKNVDFYDFAAFANNWLEGL